MCACALVGSSQIARMLIKHGANMNYVAVRGVAAARAARILTFPGAVRARSRTPA